MEIFLDTSFLVSLLIETKKSDKAINYFERAEHRFVTSVSVFEETLYTGVRLRADEKLKIRGRYHLQDYIKKKGYTFAKDFLANLYTLSNIIDILPDTNDVRTVLDVAVRYKLMPNDALIASTCKHYNIKHIATFDEDFKRVKFLRIVDL